MNTVNSMEDRRTAIAVLICILIVICYSELFINPYTRPPLQPTAPLPGAPVAPVPAAQQPVAISQPSAVNGQPVTATTAQPMAENPTPAQLAALPSTKIQTELADITISHLGGRLTSFKLREHKRDLGSDEPFEMVVVKDGGTYPLGVYAGDVSDAFVEYKLEGASNTAAQVAGGRFVLAQEDLNLKLIGTHSSGIVFTKTFTFKPDSYLFEVNLSLSQPTRDGSRIWLEWVHLDALADSHSSWDFTGMVRLGQNKLETVRSADVARELVDKGNSDWIGFADKYFLSALIPAQDGTANSRAMRAENTFHSRVAGRPDGGSFSVYVGPKQYSSLTRLPYNLHRSIDLGIFSFLAHPLLWSINQFYKLFGNYGLAIVLLTLVIKALFLPLTQKSFESARKMQEVGPEMKALREKFKDDPTRLNQELMALYKRKGVNPLGGCLPILIQLPVFLGLYNALLYAIELRHASFALWINDLSAPETLNLFGIGIPVMVLLMGVSMFYQTWTNPAPMEPMQKKMMLFMSVFFTFMFVGFPAGLTLYWLVNNLISIVQQNYIRTDKNSSPAQATAIASLAIFGLAFVLTLL